MQCGGALLTTARGRQAAPLQRVEDEDEFENEDDLVAVRRARRHAGYIHDFCVIRPAGFSFRRVR
jgi:hypothetical protein